MNTPTPGGETTYLAWYCRSCRRTCRTQPAVHETGCRCATPVPGLRPTRITQVHAVPARPVQALTDEEARLRALARRGKRVRVVYEAEVTEAWMTTGWDGIKRIEFVVTTPDGDRLVVNPARPGVHVEAAPDGVE